MPCPDLKTCVLATGKEHCSHWMGFTVEEQGRARLREDCTFNWLAHFLYDSNVKLVGIQQPIEQTRNVLLDAAQKRKRIDGLPPLPPLHDGPQGNLSHGESGSGAPRGLPSNGGGSGGPGGEAA